MKAWIHKTDLDLFRDIQKTGKTGYVKLWTYPEEEDDFPVEVNQELR